MRQASNERPKVRTALGALRASRPPAPSDAVGVGKKTSTTGRTGVPVFTSSAGFEGHFFSCACPFRCGDAEPAVAVVRGSNF